MLQQSLDDIVKSTESICKEIDSKIKENEENKESPPDDLATLKIFQMNTKLMASMLKHDSVQKIANDLSEYIDANAVEMIILLMCSVGSYSMSQSIINYDEMIGDTLKKIIDPITDQINKLTASVKAYDAVLNVHKTKIGEIEKKIGLLEAKGLLP